MKCTLTWGELLTVFARFTEDEPLTEYYTGEHWAKDSVNKAFTLGWFLQSANCRFVPCSRFHITKGGLGYSVNFQALGIHHEIDKLGQVCPCDFTLGWLEYTEIFDPGRIVTTGEMVNLIQEVFRWNNEYSPHVNVRSGQNRSSPHPTMIPAFCRVPTAASYHDPDSTSRKGDWVTLWIFTLSVSIMK